MTSPSIPSKKTKPPARHGEGATMYFVFVLLTTIILPIGFTLWQATGQPVHAIAVFALKWFVIWGVGVRLGVAGARQFFQPRFTAREIFKLDSDGVLTLVKELGISNLAAGIVALLSILQPSFALPIAIWAALFYAIAGFSHLGDKHRGFKENVALVTDLFMFAALTVAASGAVFWPA